MKSTHTKIEQPAGQPISVGMTCWFWQRRAPRLMQRSQRFGVKSQLTERFHGLHREI
jgi:hypothetical protein